MEEEYLKSPHRLSDQSRDEWFDHIHEYERVWSGDEDIMYLNSSYLKEGGLYKHTRFGLVVFLGHVDDCYADIIAPDGRPRIVRSCYFQKVV